jgi:hypothetical protein
VDFPPKGKIFLGRRILGITIVIVSDFQNFTGIVIGDEIP